MRNKEFWLSNECGWIIEVDITFRCNLACRHCNRLCNSEKNYNVSRSSPDMKAEHIDFLCSEIRRFPKGKIRLVRIIGGEPLLSPILAYSINKLEELLNEGHLVEIKIVSNGTITIPSNLEQYVTLSPQTLNELFIKRGGIILKEDVYHVKNKKHRNITLSPKDYNQVPKLCDRVLSCGINYSNYGFSLCAPCLPAMIVFPHNHKRFLHSLPNSYRGFLSDGYEKEVSNFCSFCLGKHRSEASHLTDSRKKQVMGNNWALQVQKNSKDYTEPNSTWILQAN